jgi:OPA family sugar phosphate sensor protein UhpC-like MFS transporter
MRRAATEDGQSMFRTALRFLATRPDRPVIDDDATIARRYRRARWTTFLAVTGGYSFYYTARMGLSVAKRPMIQAGIADAGQLGRIGSALLLSYAVGKFANGFLADRAHIGRFMSLGLLVSAALNILFGFSGSFFLFAVLWALNGWFQSMGCAPSVVNLSHWFSPRQRGTLYSLWSTAHSIGEGLTFVGTAAVVAAWGWRWAFWAPGLVCLIVALILLFTILDRPRSYGLPSIAELEREPEPVQRPALGRLQLDVLSNPTVWVLGLASASLYVTRFGMNSWLVLYLQEAKGYGDIDAGITASFLPIVGVFGIMLAGTISDAFFRSRRVPVLLLYGVLLLGALIGLYFVPPGERLWDRVLVGAIGFAVGGLLVFLGGLMAVDLCPREATGTAMGFIGLFSYLGAAIQDWVSGLLLESQKTLVGGVPHYGFERAYFFWVAAAALSLLLTLALGPVRRWTPKTHG